MIPTKQIVYIPVKVEEELPKKEGDYCVLSKCNTKCLLETYDTLKFQNGKFQEIPNWSHIHWLKPQEGYFFTEEQLLDYATSLIISTIKNTREYDKSNLVGTNLFKIEE